MLVGGDTLALVELDADSLEAETLDARAAADRDEHEVGVDGLAVPEVDGQRAVLLLDLRALLLEVQRDAAPPELLRELLRRVLVLLRDERGKHLDDRHLAPEPAEDRRELAADDASAEDDEPLRNLVAREQAGRVDAQRRVEALDGRTEREGAGRDDSRLEGDVLTALDGDLVRALERAAALDPLDAVRLEE